MLRKKSSNMSLQIAGNSLLKIFDGFLLGKREFVKGCLFAFLGNILSQEKENNCRIKIQDTFFLLR